MPNHVEAFFDEIGLKEMLNDPKFATREARIENKEIVRDAMIEALQSDTAENWEKRLAPRGVPVAKINSVSETSKLEQLKYRNILAKVPTLKVWKMALNCRVLPLQIRKMVLKLCDLPQY